MEIIDGRKIAQQILLKVREAVSLLSFQPVFCDVNVGEDPVAAQYVKMKGVEAQKAGIKFLKADFPSGITTRDLLQEIEKLNNYPNICGLIVQLPLPEGLDQKQVLNSIHSKIDVDCTGQKNKKLFYEGRPYLGFPTALAVLELLDSLKTPLYSKKFLVVGQGELVGRPVSFLLKQRGWEVNTADKFTPNILDLLGQADVIISAAGRANLITGEKIKPGSILIDAGTSELGGGIVGDVDKNSVEQKAALLSPVPGGVGPVTVAMLLSNVVRVAKELIHQSTKIL